MRTIVLKREAFDTSEQFHGHMQHLLGFPPYYGKNLAALGDCLEDVCEPTRIELDRDECSDAARMDPTDRSEGSWYLRALRVVQRAGVENDFLDVVVS